MSFTRREFVALGAAAALAKQPDGDVFFASITELNARLRKKEFSCVELTKAFCDRLEKLGPTYNALSLSLRKEAIQDAKDIDGEIKRDRLRSVLQGIPYGAKDLFSLADHVTTWGAKPYVAQVFDYTAAVLKKLEKARAVLIGKLAMVELAGGPNYGSAGASITGPCLNPWNRDYWAGGSSSGSGAAVAAGLVPFALGTETSGSIVTPASFCGITGLRPTFGLVSRHGAMALSPSLDKVGPMCRTAEDCGHVLAAIAGGDGNDSGSARKSFYYVPQFARPLKDLKIGFSPAEFDTVPVEGARPALRAALDVVRSFGAQMVEKTLPPLPYNDTVSALISAEAGYQFRELIESGKVDELADRQQIEGLKNSLKTSAADYLKAKQAQGTIAEAFAKLFYDVDVYLSPSRLAAAPKANEPFAPQRSGGRSPIIAASNAAGVPALSLPCGFVDGLPLGIQFLGPHFSENRILSFGVEFQRRTEWHKKHPQI